MLLQIFTIHDKKAGAYLPPFFLPQRGMALRTFGDCVNDKEHSFCKHPEDYTLMSIGTFDDVTCKTKITNPESLGNGLEFLVKNEDIPWERKLSEVDGIVASAMEFNKLSDTEKQEFLGRLNSGDIEK